MARRPAYFIEDGKVNSKMYSFEWFNGFSKKQKQRSVESLHDSIKKSKENANPLEISTKSNKILGTNLSAFNLKIGKYKLENVFQSSKVFEDGGPYIDLLNVSPRDAKRDNRLRNSGNLVAFRYNNEDFPLEPKTLFYDYIYLLAVKDSIQETKLMDLIKYNYFTDIEFNPNRSINTQAKSITIIKLLLEEYKYLPDFTKEEFINYHKEHVNC